MSHLVHHLTFVVLIMACSIIAAQQPATSQPSPQIQPGAEGTRSNSPSRAAISGPPPLEFAFLSGSVDEGKLMVVVPQVVWEKTLETQTRKKPVVENGVTKYIHEAYTVEKIHYKVVPATRSVELKDVFRWDGAVAASAAAEVVQKFIDAQAPVILIESPGSLAATPVNQSAIRRGALLVQSPVGVTLAAAASLPPDPVQPAPELKITLPKNPPPQLVTVGKSHNLPPGDQDTLTITKSVPVPVTKQISVEVESNGQNRTEAREIQVIEWKPVFEQMQVSRLSVTDKAGAKLTLQDLLKRMTQPTVCVDNRNAPFDSAYLVTLSESVLVLTPPQSAPPAGQTAPAKAPTAAAKPASRLTQPGPAASAATVPLNWVGASVVPVPNIQLKAAGTSNPLEWRSIGALPWNVTHEKDNFVWIGKTWAKKDQVIPVSDSKRDRQLIKFSEAVRREPKNAWNYVNRSYFWDEVDDTLADLEAALRLDKNSYIVHTHLHALQRAGQWQAVLDGWNAQLRANPKDAGALASRALILAASPDRKIRNGRQAVADATQACESSQWQDPRAVDSLAAAYAETGDFDSAIKWKEKANKLHKTFLAQPDVALQDPRFVQMLDAPLALYRQGQPYRLPAQEPNPPPPIMDPGVAN